MAESGGRKNGTDLNACQLFRTVVSGIHVAPVHGNGLAGDEVAIGAGEEDESAKEILWVLVAFEGAHGHGAGARGLHVTRIFRNPFRSL